MARKASSSKAAPARKSDGDQPHGWQRFVVPWALAPAPLVAGSGLHYVWAVGRPWWQVAGFAALVSGSGGGLAWLAYHISRKAKREMLIRWHATATVAVAGAATAATMLIGLPTLWAQLCLFLGAVTAVSWNLRQFSPMRSETREDDQGSRLEEALGMANTRVVGKPVRSGARVEVKLVHERGDTVDNAQGAVRALEAIAKIPRGRSRVVGDPDNAGESTLTLITEDVLKSIRPYPGPFHPGGSIADPLPIGRHEDDLPAQLWLPGDARLGRPAIHLLEMGMTGTGKTRAGLILLTEMATRRDVVILFSDTVKGAQTVGPVRPALALYADTEAKVRRMFKGVQRMVQARANALGLAGYQQWEPACYEDPNLRMPYVVWHMEEADVYIGTEEFVWVMSKARSAGVSIICSLQRASHDSMPTSARFNFGGFMCFGCGDDYSASFALSEATIKAGANPEVWKNYKPGYFYLEAAGVNELRFPVPAKAMYADDEQIAATIAEFRHVRAELDPLSVEALADAWTLCQPNPQAGPVPAQRTGGAVVLDGEFVVADADAGFGAGEGEDDMAAVRAEMATERDELAGEVAAEIGDPEPDLPVRADPAGLRPGDELPPFDGDDFDFSGGAKPAPRDKAAAEAALDAILVKWAEEGRLRFTVQELSDAYPFRHRSWFSKRLAALAEDESINPPGLMLRRDDDRLTGIYYIELLAGAGAYAGPSLPYQAEG